MDPRDLAPASERVRPSNFDFNSLSSEELLTCPYNSNHKIRRPRFAKHLVQCRQQNLYKGFEICLYNFTHHVPGKQMDQHLQVKLQKKLRRFKHNYEYLYLFLWQPHGLIQIYVLI